MVKRALAMSIRADYLLMDSWFAFSALLAALGKHLSVICMGKVRILAGVVVKTKKDQKVKIVFVRHCPKRQWLAVLSAKVDLADEEIVRIYGKRWDSGSSAWLSTKSGLLALSLKVQCLPLLMQSWVLLLTCCKRGSGQPVLRTE
jgi:hypothetical protein